MATLQTLPDFLRERGIDVEATADAFYDYVQHADSHNLDAYKEQEHAVEESKYFFYLLTGIHFKDGKKFRNRNNKRGKKSSDEEEE